MNEDELAANPRLDAYNVKDLNREPPLDQGAAAHLRSPA